MGPRSNEIDDQSTADSAPEDVAALYSWANLQGAKYRDYSASRREYRAQVRYRAARAMLERELKAQVEAEAAAAGAERLAAAQRGVGFPRGSEVAGTEAISDETARLAAAERVEAARRAESAARAAVLALREEREIAEAHSSAKRQAQIYEESELRRRQLAGPQPQWPMGAGYGEVGDLRSDHPGLQFSLLGGNGLAEDSHAAPDEVGEAADTETVAVRGLDDEQNAPAWLFSAQALLRPQTAPAVAQTFRGDVAGGDTLQDSRERVAARWFALKDVFDHAAPELPAMQPLRARAEQRPVLVVFSLSGGVGKTSLLATLGRALSAEGEKVAVADTTSQGLLPIYFGSNQAGRNGSTEGQQTKVGTQEPVSLLVHDAQGCGNVLREQETLTEEILQGGHGNHRLLIDLATGSSWLIRRVVDLNPTVLVPVAPDMNSVISMQAIERLFRGIVGAEGRSLLPFYVLNHFDASLPLHLDVREVFRRQLGDRLLPFAIRRSPLVSEALAEGMTVLDYAPEARVSQDYKNIANWLRSISPPMTEEIRSLRRGEG
jgi:cellulose synthase operon protein YhjQ